MHATLREQHASYVQVDAAHSRTIFNRYWNKWSEIKKDYFVLIILRQNTLKYATISSYQSTFPPPITFSQKFPSIPDQKRDSVTSPGADEVISWFLKKHLKSQSLYNFLSVSTTLSVSIQSLSNMRSLERFVSFAMYRHVIEIYRRFQGTCRLHPLPWRRQKFPLSGW